MCMGRKASPPPKPEPVTPTPPPVVQNTQSSPAPADTSLDESVEAAKKGKKDLIIPLGGTSTSESDTGLQV
tara:strand:- start:12585 stop:12797 length:213 start_codon:yes stop_codon:yes gene_type:complete